MKNIIIAFGIIWGAMFYTGSASLMAQTSHQATEVSAHQEGHQDQDDHQSDTGQANAHAEGDAEHAHAPVWLVIPFVALLLMIATGPLFYEHFWHHNYPKVAIILASLVVLYYIFAMHNTHAPVHALAEYLQFIALLASLYIASGGIMISIDKKSTPLANVTLLIVGSIIANFIGTTGASMLLIRPFIRLNKNNIRAYHIIFFIFMVSNVGGSLTPIGDPPLFLGFLKGVPFFWTLEHNWPAWGIALIILALAFFFIDKKLGRAANDDEIEDTATYSNKISLIGSKNFLWLLVVIISVFLDPNVLDWVPAIVYDGTKFSFIRELIMFSVAFFSYKFADKRAIQGNEFNFEPIREVAFIFIGIFGTMMPALELVGNFAKSPAGAELITHNSLYWGTGLLSGFLDNAPTYLNFLAAAMASRGASIGDVEMVRKFAMDGYHDSAFQLMAISIASVFFGAMTYIGNGPNFMVKSIAEQSGIKMPSFFGYIIRFSIPILLPLLIITWLIFFAFV
ncbi:citrate transporter [Echinicola soli]|uniref:Citrate transporter n=1 Tax=Echinicola soli TaxID=2591634 RepID=A0A514CFS2_9BACT|nr:sodium:proton antiporter [Echinicola soli]QDH78663.1 citrate transporter [Echinicola soli]